jgi:hypothetical protein
MTSTKNLWPVSTAPSISQGLESLKKVSNVNLYKLRAIFSKHQNDRGKTDAPKNLKYTNFVTLNETKSLVSKIVLIKMHNAYINYHQESQRINELLQKELTSVECSTSDIQ